MFLFYLKQFNHLKVYNSQLNVQIRHKTVKIGDDYQS